MSAATVSAAELAGATLDTLPPPPPAPAAGEIPANSPEVANSPANSAAEIQANSPKSPLAWLGDAGNSPASSPQEMPAMFGRDRDGELFDPAKHLPEKDGNRRWKKIAGKRRGRPPGAASSSSPTNPPESNGTAAGGPTAPESFVAPDPAAPPTPAGPDKYDLAADLYCRAFYAVADSTFAGKGEWVPDNDAEHESLRAAAAAYMRAKGMEDLPPGPALLLAVGTYSAKRIQRPNTNTRWRMIVAYWRAKFASWWSGRKIEHLAPVEAVTT